MYKRQLLTHNHIDHYEPSVPTHLPKETPFYVQPQDADAIRNDGFTNVIPIEEIKTIDGISIYRTTEMCIIDRPNSTQR